MQLGIEESDASLLISVIGIGSVIGKLVLGYISDLPCINRLYLNSMSLGVCGLSVCEFNKSKPVMNNELNLSVRFNC